MMLHCALGGLGDNSFPSLFPSIILPSFSEERGLVKKQGKTLDLFPFLPQLTWVAFLIFSPVSGLLYFTNRKCTRGNFIKQFYSGVKVRVGVVRVLDGQFERGASVMLLCHPKDAPFFKINLSLVSSLVSHPSIPQTK